MPLVLFLLDTSASMQQRTHLGTTYLDVAKGAVETFLQLRARYATSRGDRYMLVTCEEPPAAVKTGWKENHATFMNELRNLQAQGLTTLGQSLRTAFDLLNLNRLVTGIDNYGQGRNPFFLEPAIIIIITDGGKLTSTCDVEKELHLPLNSPLPGSELTKEPFRWDQRLFALVLRLPGISILEPEQTTTRLPLAGSIITPMCEVTGGRSYCVGSPKMLHQCLESLVQKVQSGVVINFEKSGSDSLLLEDGPMEIIRPPPWHSSHKLIYVRPNLKTGVPTGHWPIPESFWPDQNLPALPPRTSHPIVKFSCTDCEPILIDNLPFDKYELEPSPLTQYILQRKSPHTCWQVFVSNSAKYRELGYPFGYLKASAALNCVNLFVMPYNYPVLLPLLDCMAKPTLQWKQSFESYLQTMPPYYLGPLKKAVRMMGAPSLISDGMTCGLSYSVVSYLKKLRQQAKMEMDRVIGFVSRKIPSEPGIKVQSRSPTRTNERSTNGYQQLLQGIVMKGIPLRLVDCDTKEYPGFKIAVLKKDLKPQTFRNAYDVPRRNLMDQLTRMKYNFLRNACQSLKLKRQDEDQLHSVPIAHMGNYQEYMKQRPLPLRELDPAQPRRLHTFGNPFKLDKEGMKIDEADEFVSGSQSKHKCPGEQMRQRSPKRRRCILPLQRGGRPSPLPVARPTEGPSSLAADLVKLLPGHKVLEASTVTATDIKYVLDPLSSDFLLNMVDDEDSVTPPSISPLEQSATLGQHLQTNIHVDPFMKDHEFGGDGQWTEPSMAGTFPRKDEKKLHFRSHRDINKELKAQIIKEIRKPGRKYQRIFFLFKYVQGNLQTQLEFLQEVIKEAARFKKRVLIEQLQNYFEACHHKPEEVDKVEVQHITW